VLIDEGRLIETSELQSEKHDFGIVRNPSGMVKPESDEHLEKQDDSKVVIDEGRDIETSELQSKKHDFGIVAIPLGIVI
jgi:hypothetical protein